MPTPLKLQQQDNLATKLQPFVCGGLAACIASTIIHPVDLVKVRIQLQSGNLGALAIAKNVVKANGVTGLYAGLSASLTRQATYGTARIGLHRVFSKKLSQMNDGQDISFFQKVMSGMTSGAIAVCIGTPFDVALVRMQNDGAMPKELRRGYSNVGNALSRIVKEEGLLKLWSGLAPNILRGASMNVGMMACYDQAKQTITSITKQPDSYTTKLGSAATAGFCCAILSLPFDMIKSRLQNQTIDKITGKPQFKGVIDCATKILQKEGVFAFWKGFGSYYMRCAPHAMVILLSVEFITMQYRQLFAQSGELTIKSLADSARVIEEAQVPTSNRVVSIIHHVSLPANENKRGV